MPRRPEGGGFHSSLDPVTGEVAFSGGVGGNRIGYDENGQEIRDSGGSGYHYVGNYYAGEYDCNVSPGTSVHNGLEGP